MKRFKVGDVAEDAVLPKADGEARAKGVHAEQSAEGPETGGEFSAKISRDEDRMVRQETGGFLEKINKLPRSAKKYVMTLGLAGMLMAGYEVKNAGAEDADPVGQQTYSTNEPQKMSPEQQAAWNRYQEHIKTSDQAARQEAWNQFLAQKNAADQSYAQEMARVNQTYQMKKFEITSRSVQNIFLRQPGSIWQGSREMMELDIRRQREATHLKQLHDSQVMQAQSYYNQRTANK